MKKKVPYLRNFKTPALLLICLVSGATSFAQPMEKSVTSVSFPVNIKGVAKDMDVEVDLSYLNAKFYPSYDSTKLTVNIDNPNGKKLRITVTGPSGEVFSHFCNDKEGYHKRFDFNQAEDGIYTLIVTERGKTRLIKQINYNTVTETVVRKMEIVDPE